MFCLLAWFSARSMASPLEGPQSPRARAEQPITSDEAAPPPLELLHEQSPSLVTNFAAIHRAPKRRRGRPPGSPNRPKKNGHDPSSSLGQAVEART
jgi:hypothetical protein